jgi:hypothetical protein
VNVDVEQFYEQDPRRRRSDEIELGQDWTDEKGVRFELSWVKDTGEMYAMRETLGTVIEDPFQDASVVPPSTKSITVEVLGAVSDEGELDRLFAGWQDAMPQGGSLEWARERLSSRMPAPPTSKPEPVEEGEDRLPGSR